MSTGLTDAEMANIALACLASMRQRSFRWESQGYKRIRVTTLNDGRVSVRLLVKTPELLAAVVHYCRDNHAQLKQVTIGDFVITFWPRPPSIF